MFFERIRSRLKTFRVRVMLLNTLMVFVVSMGVLLGARASVRTTLQHEMDAMLVEDLNEVELAVAAAGDPDSPQLLAQLDRKARGHVQHSWFCELQRITNSSGVSKEDLTATRVSNRALDSTEWHSVNTPTDWRGLPFDALTPTTYRGFRIVERVSSAGLESPIRIRVGAYDTLVRRDQSLIDRIVLTALGIGLVIAPIGGYWLAGFVTQPLANMVQTTNRLHPENLQERLAIRGTNDEMDQLSKAFNFLLDRIANYLQNKRDFLANAAHELRTPMAAIQSSAELALRRSRTSEEYQEVLASMLQEVESLSNLVNQLLLLAETDDLAAFHSNASETFDLSELATQCCDMFEPIAETKAIRYLTSIEPNIEYTSNKQHLRQVFNNLIDNALKFTPDGGTVQISLSRASEMHPQILFSVEDTGEGISPTELPRLFERFYRGDRNRRRQGPLRSTGLGLSICHAVVNSLGGEIAVISDLKQGSRFTVSLPS